MANLFAYRATDPAHMKAAKDPIGPENNKWLKKLAHDADLVVAAWGNDGAYLGRSTEVREMLPQLSCLRLNKSGEPAHPLYQAAALKPMPLNRIFRKSRER